MKKTFVACSSWGSAYVVPSETSDETYLVKFSMFTPPVCTCPAYRYSGEYDDQTCKHIKEVSEYGCFRVQDANTGEEFMASAANDLESRGIKLFSTTKRLVVQGSECATCKSPLLLAVVEG